MAKLTYPDYPNLCGWNTMLPPRSPNPSLEGGIRVDYAIIGAGYTGLAAARRLAELRASSTVALLEATEVGEGASARNSGFTGTDILPRDVTLAKAEAARAQSRLFAEAFDWLCGQIEAHGIDCDMRQVGSIRGAITARGEEQIRKVMGVARQFNIEHQPLSRADIAARTGTDYYRFGLYFPGSWLLQPAALVRGLAESLTKQIKFYENTPVIQVAKQGGEWCLSTPQGQVHAKNLILANNGFIRKFDYLKTRMATIYTYVGVSERVGESELGALGQDEAWGLLPSHRLGTTLRRIGRDRLMVRSLYALERELPQPQVVAELRRRFEQRWPDLRHIPFEYVWSGTTAFTMNGAPSWGRLDEGLYASGGCNGSGIIKGTMLGKHLAELACGLNDGAEVKRVMGQASFIAPEPFRSIGFHIISQIEKWRAGKEI